MFRIEHSEKDPRECYLIDADSSVLLMERVEEDRIGRGRGRGREVEVGQLKVVEIE